MFFMPLVIIALILLQFDEPLSPEVPALVEQTTAKKTNEAYLYLLGIDAPLNGEPSDIGESLLAYSREQDQLEADDPFTTERAPWPDYEALARPEGAFFCRWTDENCRVRVLSSWNEAPALSEADKTVLDRYRTFMTMDGFQSLAKPSVHEPMPSFHYLLSGHRLVMLEALREADRGDPEAAVRLLESTLDRVRTQLVRADTIIGKMVYLALMSENLDVLSEILARHGYDLAPEVPPMTRAERDFTLAMAREFAMGYYMYQSLDRHPQFFDTSSDNTWTPGWWVRAVFKPNMTINSVLPAYLQAIELSQLTPKDYREQVNEAAEIEVKASRLRNPTGTILARAGGPAFQNYVTEAFNIHGKLSLLNQVIAFKGVPDDLKSLNNPLSRKNNGVQLSHEGQQLCLSGHGEDNRGFRCLIVQNTQYE